MGMMQSVSNTARLGTRVLTLIALGALLLVALSMVRHLIDERTERARSVQSSMAVGGQTVGGPVLMMPYTQSTWRRSPGKDWELSTEDKLLKISPELLQVDGLMEVELLKRGLYVVPSYGAKLAMKGHFSGEAAKALLASEGRTDDLRVALTWHTPYVSMAVRQPRGIRDLKGQLDNHVLKFLPGREATGKEPGVHALWAGTGKDLATALAQASPLSFSFQLDVAGSEDLFFEPIGEQSHFVLRGNWPHPSFVGNVAPLSRQVNDKGFEVTWKSNPLAVGFDTACNANPARAGDVVIEAATPVACGSGTAGTTLLGLRLFDPVDRYVLVDRTAKYGELFLLLTFGAVFLLEVLRRKAVHPLQYGLVGCALALFFVLTLALSEHIAFGKAYALAAGGTIALLAYYARYMLDDRKTGIGFGLALALLYGVLYAVLRAEDVALLIGSLTLFAALTLFMVLTRKVDWFGGQDETADTPAKSPHVQA